MPRGRRSPPGRLLLAAASFLAAASLLAPGLAPAADEPFVDVTARAGIEFRLENGARGKKFLFETMIGGAGWLDFDGDGWLDLYLVQGHSDAERAYAEGKEMDVLYRNRGDGTFEDVTARAGLGDRHYGAGPATGDIDNDGDTDLYVTSYGPNVLYRNNGDGTFTDITREAGVACPLWSAGAAFADINGDGLLDLYVANYLLYDPRRDGACTGNPRKIPSYCHPNKFDGAPDSLFLNRGGGRFEDISQAAGVAVTGRILAKGLGVLPTDFDLDGDVDIFVANDSVPNFLWRNLGGGSFEDAALEAGVALSGDSLAQACMGIDGGDVNGDGLMDYMVTNFSEETDTLYLGQGDGFFEDATARAGLATATFLHLAFGLGFVDHDLDGDLDIYIACGHIMDNIRELHPGGREEYAQSDQLLENDGRASFRDIAAASGAWFRRKHVGRGAAFADYDNDGDVDILVVNVDASAVLLESRPPAGRHWVGLALEGRSPSNRDALGARVELAVRGREQPVVLEVRTSSSYLAANDPRRSVGLGEDGEPAAATVHWPSGRVEVFEKLERDRYNRLVEGTGKAAAAAK
jgi:hypothetical protein